MSDIKQYEPLWGSWYVDSLIGEGSFGKVYKVRREEFGKTYYAAVKIITIPQNEADLRHIRSEGLDEASVRSYFQAFVADIIQEIDLMSAFKGNSNIVSFEDHKVIEQPDGIGWDILIRMELLTSLSNYVNEKPLSREEIIKLGIHICRALELCAVKKTIHRDIKPDNIFVSEYGEYKLGDFGIARQIERTASGLSKKGTYTYMAPEVFKGDEYGSSVDTYSLGIVMYRFLNQNRTPFLPDFPAPITPRDRDESLNRRMKGEALPLIQGAEPSLNAIILKACAYGRKARYSSPTEMREALEAIAGGKSFAPAPTSMYSATIDERTSDGTAGVFGSSLTEPKRAGEKTSATEGMFTDAPSSARYASPYHEATNRTEGVFDAPPPRKTEYSEDVPEVKKKDKTGIVIFLSVAALLFLVYAFVSSYLNDNRAVIGSGDYTDESGSELEAMTSLPTEEANEQTPVFYANPLTYALIDYLPDFNGALASVIMETFLQENYVSALDFQSTVSFDDINAQIANGEVYDFYFGISDIDYWSRQERFYFSEPYMYGEDGNPRYIAIPLTADNAVELLRMVNDAIAGLEDDGTLATLHSDWGLRYHSSEEDRFQIEIAGELVWSDALELDLSGHNLSDISPLQAMTDLETLILSDNQISDITPLTSLTNLNSLYLDYNQVSDITPLQSMSGLRWLNLGANQITDISPLMSLTNLTDIDLGVNQISDLTPLQSLTNLNRLALNEVQINDLTPLQSLTNLNYLYLKNNQISDISPLQSLTRLSTLELNGNQLSDITPLSSLTDLTRLTLWSMEISDIAPLQMLSNLTYLELGFNRINNITPLQSLTNLTELYLSGNQIGDFQPLQSLTNLTHLSLLGSENDDITPLQSLTELIYLDLQGNQISDLTPLQSMTKLETLYMWSNEVSDLTPLQSLTSLTTLKMQLNQISDITPLQSLTNLTTLDLSQNQISDLEPLKSLTNLTELDFGVNRFDIAQAEEILAALPNCDVYY